MINKVENEIIASSNKEEAIKALYYILLSRYKFNENDIELHIGHTSVIYVDSDIFESHYEFDRLKSYCEGFIDGIDEDIDFRII